jgi:4-hydroxy-tetrahydrodipicolinate reductase
MTRITLLGATGWVGRALVLAIEQQEDLKLVAALSRKGAGQALSALVPGSTNDLPVSGTIEEALQAQSDVVIDYTKPHVVKGHVLAALQSGRHAVVGTSGMTDADYVEIDSVAKQAGRGVLAAGNFSITATLLRRFALEAARYVPDVEIIDYASPTKPDTPSGTGRELAEALAAIRSQGTSLPLSQLTGAIETRGAALGTLTPVQVHSVRMPSYILSCEALFGAPDERLVIRHDAGATARPYVAGTLLAARKVGGFTGLRRGLDAALE